MFERKQAKKDGVRLHPGSGSGRIKHDASDEDRLVEYKHALKTHALNGLYLLAFYKRAIKQDKEPVYIVHLEEAGLTLTITMERTI